MKAKKIVIQGQTRIGIDGPNNEANAALFKQINGSMWSQADNSWHIPYTKISFTQLLQLFPDIEYPKKPTEIATTREPGSPEKITERILTKNVTVEVIGRIIMLKLPKNPLDIHFIRSLRYSRWDKKQFCWLVPNYPGNLDLIKDYFNERIKDFILHDTFDVRVNSLEQRTIRSTDLIIIKTRSGRLRLIFSFNKALSEMLRKMPFNNWDSKNKWWSVACSEKILKDIKTFAESIGLEVHYEEEAEEGNACRVKRIAPDEIPNYRSCPEEFTKKLEELRYSPKTIKTYKGLFEEFINYYHQDDIDRINEKMILVFLQYLVIDRKISTSYQNQSINAIKFYYERVRGGQRKTYYIERPIREKTLPVVLNEEEVIHTIRQVKNIKHLAIITLIYSSGLRLGELINLKIKDIDSNRMQVFIRQAKGRKDRYTLLSKKALSILRQYFEVYRPKEWLFEGATGRQYSESSVQTIVKEAFRKAGIRKKVSTHTLRHCFGTHLLENGTDLRYIQALMGHSSSKTTEIYTHITTKGFDQIENPLDKLDF